VLPFDVAFRFDNVAGCDFRVLCCTSRITIRMEGLIVMKVYFVCPELRIHFDVTVVSLLCCLNK
jgi:hypothetical protein